MKSVSRQRRSHFSHRQNADHNPGVHLSAYRLRSTKSYEFKSTSVFLSPLLTALKGHVCISSGLGCNRPEISIAIDNLPVLQPIVYEFRPLWDMASPLRTPRSRLLIPNGEWRGQCSPYPALELQQQSACISMRYLALLFSFLYSFTRPRNPTLVTR